MTPVDMAAWVTGTVILASCLAWVLVEPCRAYLARRKQRQLEDA